MKRSLVLLFVLSASLTAQDEVKPFPENRVRDFYATQARGFLKSEHTLPKLLPQFPGLDGGGLGTLGTEPRSRQRRRATQ